MVDPVEEDTPTSRAICPIGLEALEDVTSICPNHNVQGISRTKHYRHARHADHTHQQRENPTTF